MYDSVPVREDDAASKRIGAIFNKPRRLRKSTLIAILSIVSTVSFVSLAFSSTIIVHELEQLPEFTYTDTATNDYYLTNNFDGTYSMYAGDMFIEIITTDSVFFSEAHVQNAQ